jgi:hypothetical protein
MRVPAGLREERTAEFLALLGMSSHRLVDLRVEGFVTGLDLTAVQIERTVFKNAGFIRCQFGPGAAFVNCSFDGSFALQGCEGLTNDAFVNCRMSQEARRAVQQAVGARGAFAITETQIRDGLRDALRQMGAPARLHPIDEPTRRRGRLYASAIGEPVWEALIEHGVVERQDIGRGRDSVLYSVRKESVAAVTQFMNSGLAVETVGRALDALKKKFVA